MAGSCRTAQAPEDVPGAPPLPGPESRTHGKAPRGGENLAAGGRHGGCLCCPVRQAQSLT